MPILEIEGRQVEVPESFMQLSPEDQVKYADEVGIAIGLKPKTAAPNPVVEGAKLAGSAGVRGVERMLGAPADIAGLADDALTFVANQTGGRIANAVSGEGWGAPSVEASQKRRREIFDYMGLPNITDGAALRDYAGGQAFVDLGEKVHGPLTQPKSFGGKVANTAIEMAVGGGASAIPKVARMAKEAPQIGKIIKEVFKDAAIFGAAPGAVSEVAGQATKDTGYEGEARFLSGLLTALVGHGATKAGGEQAVLRRALDKVSVDDLRDAYSLMSEAEKMGTPLTWGEAVASVTGGKRQGLARVEGLIAGTPHAPELMEFHAKRADTDAGPGQIRMAVNKLAKSVAPTMRGPTRTGMDLKDASEEIIRDAEKTISRRTKPLYAKAEWDQLPTDDYAYVKDSPLVKRTIKELETDPAFVEEYANFLRQNPNNIKVLDAVKKRLAVKEDSLLSAVTPTGVDKHKSAQYTKTRVDLTNRMREASPAFAKASDTHGKLTGAIVDPMRVGIPGKMSGTEKLESQIGVVFPAAPNIGHAVEAGQYAKRLAKKNLPAAREFVRQHVETTLNKASDKRTQYGKESAGPEFSYLFRGNPEQAKTAEAVIKALPGGKTVWDGANKLMDVFDAMQYRARPNSNTMEKTELARDLERGSAVSEAGKAALSPGRAMTKIGQLIDRWQMGKGANAISKMMTDPKAFGDLARMAKANTWPMKLAAAAALANRLAMYNREPWDIQIEFNRPPGKEPEQNRVSP